MASQLFAVYYCLTFWALICTEAILVRRGVDLKSRFAHEDRFIGYLFIAPFVWPFRLFQLYKLSRRVV